MVQETETPKRTRRTKEQIAADKAEHEAQQQAQADKDLEEGANRMPPDGLEGETPDPTMPIGGRRSSAGRHNQTAMDEIILNAEDNLDLIRFIEQQERTEQAHKEYMQAGRNRDRKLEELGIKGGPHRAYRLRDFRIVYVPGEGETKHVEMDRAPISKIHVNRITE